MSGTEVIERPTTSPARLLQWTPRSSSSSLMGFATVGFPGGWTVTSIPIYRAPGDGSLSAGSPSTPEVMADGRVRLTADGKRVYTKIIKFEGDAAFQRWNSMVLGALAEAGIRP